MNTARLVRATLIGVAAQLLMVISGHYLAPVKAAFMWGGLGLSLLAGALYAARSGGSWGSALAGGAVAGGVCAFVGIAVSCALGDVEPQVMLFGTIGSAVAGAIGAVAGRTLAPQRP